MTCPDMKYLFAFFLLAIILPCFGQHSLNSTKATGLLLRDKGKVCYSKGQYDSTAYYYDKASTLLAAINKQDTLADDYAELARACFKQKNYDKAIGFYNTAIAYADKTGSRFTLMQCLNQLGQVYEAKQNYRDALDYFRQSFDISDSLDFVQKANASTSEAYSRNFIGDVMGSIKQKPETEQDILKTIDTKKSLNDTLALTINYFNLGVLYTSKKMYPQALDALQNCLQYASAINYTDMQNSAANQIADLYEQTGNYRQALVYLKKHMAFSAGSKNSKTIDDLQTKYEITQREDQVLQQQFELTKRNYWIAGITIVILLMAVIGFVYYRQSRLEQRNIAMQAIIETEESERKRIAQDLHDSVSQTMMAAKMNLSAIGGELPFANDEQKKRFERAINMVDDGFKEVRTISHNMMPWALHETGLARVVKQFIDNIANDTISINFFSSGFDAPFDATTEIILYRVLQECVNNVMKHAHASRLDISLNRDEENISLTIEDNGRGFDATDPAVYKGMGVSNLRSRINFLNGKVEFDSHVGSGTLVSVYIPLKKS